MKKKNGFNSGIYLAAYWFPVIMYMVIIFYFSSLPQPLGKEVKVNSYILHIIEFFILAALLLRALNNNSNILIKENRYFVVIAITALYAVSDEFHQYFVPGRVADVFDALADIFGGLLIYLKYWYEKRLN